MEARSAAFGGAALLEAASAIKGKRLQQFAFEELDAASVQQGGNSIQIGAAFGPFLGPLLGPFWGRF